LHCVIFRNRRPKFLIVTFFRSLSSGDTVEACAREGDFYRWCQYLASDRITKF